MIGFRQGVLRLLYPLIRFLGKIRSPMDVPTLKDLHIQDIVKRCQPGDIIGTFTYGELTNIMIQGPVKHIAIAGHGDVIEAVDAGVRRKDLEVFLGTKSAVFLIRPRARLIDDGIGLAAYRIAEKQIGKPYDYLFSIPRRNLPNWTMYCSELVWFAYDSVIPHWGFTPRKVLGVPTVHPSDFHHAVQHFDTIGVWTV